MGYDLKAWRNKKYGTVTLEMVGDHIVIVTYWRSFDQHETSHADEIFKEKFSALAEMCEDTFEIGYDLLWQGAISGPLRSAP